MKKYMAIAATFLMTVFFTTGMIYAQDETIPVKLRLHANTAEMNFIR